MSRAEYLENLVNVLWDYRAKHFAERPECFDRPLSRTSRPPVFRREWEAENILSAPNISVEDRCRVIAALPLRQRHRWFATMKSSQALAQSVFANLNILNKLHVLLDVRNDDGESVFAGASAWTRMSLEHEARHLGEPRPTCVDVFFDGAYRIAVECKLSEEDVGWCSRPALELRDPNYDRDYCDGRYKTQRGRTERCPLTAIGVKYWLHIPAFLSWNVGMDQDPCPLRTTYQLVRNLLVACVSKDGRSECGNGHAVVLYDARNPAFAAGGRGWEACRSVRSVLRIPSLLRPCSWQRLLTHLQRDPELRWLLDGLREKYGLLPDSASSR